MEKLLKKVFLSFFLFFIVCLDIYTQSAPWWFSFERGKQYFRSGAYGDALLAFEDARRTRWDRFERMEDDLILVLSTAEFRRLGDALDQVEKLCADQRQDRAAGALEELYYHCPREELANSVNRALEEIGRRKAYPEAEFWLGETYRAEGEFGLALRQYQKSYDERALLETPGFEVEILYRMVELHRIRGEYQDMENRALEILNEPGRDMLWAGESQGFARAAMMRILENEGIGRFLTLYRYNNHQVEQAHRFLGLYYYASSRHNQAAEHLMFAFLIQNTLLIDEVLRQQYDFAFTDLNSLMDTLKKRPYLLDFLEDTEYFRTLYYLGTALYATGRQLPARQIWAFLAARAEAGEWGVRGSGQLRNPSVDRAREMP